MSSGSFEIGVAEDGSPMEIDLDALIGSHLCVMANSGAGKSGLVRRILETTHGHIQQIVIDPEDDMYTLRERFDYVIAGGEGGDAPATIANARNLAALALDHGFSLIAQINDLGDDAPAFVAEFLDALMSAPREKWRPLLVVIDETQRFAPRDGATEATKAVRDLVQRGRKRGFTGIFASLRMSEVDPAVRGLVNNWMLGRVGQALDRKTMANQLGFSPSSAEAKGLQSLKKRHFWGFGPALTAIPTLFRVADAETTMVRPGQAKIPTPPAPNELREILQGLASSEPTPDDVETSESVNRHGALVRENAELRAQLASEHVSRAEWETRAKNAGEQLGIARAALWDLSKRARAAGEALPLDLVHYSDEKLAEIGRSFDGGERPIPERITFVQGEIRDVDPGSPLFTAFDEVDQRRADEEPQGRAREILEVLCTLPVGSLEKAWALRAGINRKSSTWRGYKAKLREWFVQEGDRVGATAEARALFPHAKTGLSSGALIKQWIDSGDLPGGSAAVLTHLLHHHPKAIDRDALAQMVGTESGKSTFRGYLAPLSTLELIERSGDMISLSSELMS